MSKIKLAIIAILSLILGCLGYNQIKLNSINPAETYHVVSILDGDTFVIEDYHQRVRLAEVEAPDLNFHYGPESKDFLASKILGKDVYVKNIVADTYGRILAMVYLDNLFINEIMIRQGYADYSGRKIPNDPGVLQNAEKLAKEEQLGIFGPDSTQLKNPDNPACTIKGNINHKKKTYLFQGCTDYSSTIIEKHKGDQWFCTETEAKKAGFTKSKACFGKSYETTKK